MNEKIKVSIPPEAVEIVKEKYGLKDEALTEIVGNMQVSGPIEGEATPSVLPLPEPGEPAFMKQLMRGEIGIGEALVLMDYFDRKERRSRELNKDNSIPPSPTANEIGSAVAIHLKNAGAVGKPAESERPDWAEEIHNQQDEILARMRREDAEKELSEAIDKHVGPLKHELDKAHEKIKELSKPSPAGTAPQKSSLEVYLDMRKMLKDEGIIKEKESGTLMMVGADGQPIQGIPVKGEIPAALVYGPHIVEQISEIIEKRIDKIATKYGLVESPGAGPAKPKEPLIKIPEKPPKAPPTPPPPDKPPSEQILKMPEKPTLGEEVAKVPLEEKVEVPKLHAEKAEKAAGKQYFCKHCGAGPFEKPWQVANHTKGCKKAKEAKAKEKGKEAEKDEGTSKPSSD